jgi:hypothetical protein
VIQQSPAEVGDFFGGELGKNSKVTAKEKERKKFLQKLLEQK